MHFGDASHALEHVARLSTWPGELSKYPAGSEHDFPNSVWIPNVAVVLLLSTRLNETAFATVFLVGGRVRVGGLGLGLGMRVTGFRV